MLNPPPACPPGDALIVSRWPAQGAPCDEAALSHFELLKGCVRQLRNARAEYNVEPGRRVGATVVVEDAAAREVRSTTGVAWVCVHGGRLCVRWQTRVW